jgi:hypothetical protein
MDELFQDGPAARSLHGDNQPVLAGHSRLQTITLVACADLPPSMYPQGLGRPCQASACMHVHSCLAFVNLLEEGCLEPPAHDERDACAGCCS